jgi:hypothetical protein
MLPIISGAISASRPSQILLAMLMVHFLADGRITTTPAHISIGFAQNSSGVFITVLAGTWWVGAGNKFDPANLTVPMKAGTFVTDFANGVHWDGAKDEDATVLIVGEGPATGTLVEEGK